MHGNEYLNLYLQYIPFLFLINLYRWLSTVVEMCKSGTAENDLRFDGVVVVSESLDKATHFGEQLIHQSKVFILVSVAAVLF